MKTREYTVKRNKSEEIVIGSGKLTIRKGFDSKKIHLVVDRPGYLIDHLVIEPQEIERLIKLLELMKKELKNEA